MSHNADINLEAPAKFNLGYALSTSMQAVGRFLYSIVAANRFAREVEALSHASDRKLDALKLERDQIVHHLTRSSENFRAL